MSGVEFPAWLKLGYQPDGSARASFLAEVNAIVDGGKRKFDEFSREAQQSLSAALTMPRNAGGGINLDVAGLRQAALAQQDRAAAARQMAEATAIAAREQGDYSKQARLAVAATQALAVEEERAAAKARAHAEALQQVQNVLARNAGRSAGPDLSFGVDRLLAGAASIDRAAVSGTTLANVLGRVSVKSREVAEALRAAEAQAAKAASAIEAVSRPRYADNRNLVQQYVDARQAAEGLVTSSVTLETVLGRVAGKSRAVSDAIKQAQDQAARVSAAELADSVRRPTNRDFGVDALLAGKASLDAAAVSGATLESVLGRVAVKSREVAEANEASAKAMDRAQKDQAAAAARYANDLELVRRAIDPTRVAQQQLDAELARAEAAFERGAISAQEYGVAVNRAADNYGAVVTGARRGTEANHMMVNSTRALRVAMLQSGQQLQDVAISLYSGQKAGVVFAQQLPQLAFALTGLEGSANKTHDRIGRFATFLSGPWGLAAGLAIGFAGELIAEFLGIGQEAEKADKKTYDFSKTLDVLAMSASESANAMEQLANATKSAIQAQGDYLQNQVEIANQAVSDLEGRIAANQQALQRAKDEAGSFTADPTEVARRISRVSGLRSDIAADRAALEAARQAQANAQIASSQRAVIDSMDAASAATTRYNVAVGKLNTRYEEAVKLRSKDPLADATTPGLITKQQYDRELARLLAEKNRAVEDARKSNRDSSRGTSERDLAAFSSPLAGFPITSGFGKRTPPKAGASSFHAAIDIAAPVGTAVRAPQVGVVEAIGFNTGLGKYVVIDHGGGTKSRFGHLSDNSVVSEGQKVDTGDIIGKVGSTGISTGPHLDYQIKVNGKPVDPRKGLFPVDEAATAETVERAQDRLVDFGAAASESIARITAQFDEQPRLIDQAAAAARELDRIYGDLEDRKLLDPDAIKSIEAARAAVASSVDRPFREMMKAGREQAEVQDLLIQGRTLEAQVLERSLSIQRAQGVITAGQVEAIRSQVANERVLSAELERQTELRRRDAQLVEDTQQNVRQTLQDVARGGGVSALGKAFKRQFDVILQNQIDALSENLFGDFFRDSKDRALGFDKVKEASENQVRSINSVIDALNRLKISVLTASNSMPNNAAASNDNGLSAAEAIAAIRDGRTIGWNGKVNPPGTMSAAGSAGVDPATGDIVVPGMKSPRDFLGDIVTKVADVFLDAKTAKTIGEGFSKGLSTNAAAYGALASGLVLGQGGSSLGGMVGGAVGEKVLGKAFSKGLESISKGLGSLGGPLGSIVGGLLGGVIGGALKSTPRASATIGGGAGGGLEVVSIQGNSESRKKASGKSANEALDSLDRIAEALGATINGDNGSVSIGVRKGSYRVDTSGSGITKTSRGAIDFGEDSAAAIKFATMDLIKDGVLEGLRASTQRILQQGTDLDRAVQKAVDFESVFTRLKEYKDPVGAALDTLDKEFNRLKKVFEDAGASAAEYADLEELYALERAKAIKESQSKIIGSLKDLYDQLTIGDSGLSLRARQEAAMAAYTPLAARVRAGDVTAYDDFAKAAQDLLTVSREMFGSQKGYFDIYNEVTALSKNAIDAQQAIADASANRDSPFVTDAAPANDNAAVVDAIDAQTDALNARLDAVNDNLGSVIEQLKAIGAFNPANFNFAAAF